MVVFLKLSIEKIEIKCLFNIGLQLENERFEI